MERLLLGAAMLPSFQGDLVRAGVRSDTPGVGPLCSGNWQLGSYQLASRGLLIFSCVAQVSLPVVLWFLLLFLLTSEFCLLPLCSFDSSSSFRWRSWAGVRGRVRCLPRSSYGPFVGPVESFPGMGVCRFLRNLQESRGLFQAFWPLRDSRI